VPQRRRPRLASALPRRRGAGQGISGSSSILLWQRLCVGVRRGRQKNWEGLWDQELLDEPGRVVYAAAAGPVVRGLEDRQNLGVPQRRKTQGDRLPVDIVGVRPRPARWGPSDHAHPGAPARPMGLEGVLQAHDLHAALERAGVALALGPRETPKLVHVQPDGVAPELRGHHANARAGPRALEAAGHGSSGPASEGEEDTKRRRVGAGDMWRS